MSFAWLSPLWFFAGLAGLAAVLFALQRLRVRHRTVTVPTTLFWREALEDTRARVFVQRFRHPWAYVLLLAIASLAWLAVAGPKSAANEARDHVLVLDASARMAIGSRFADALHALEERAAALPRDTTRVVVAGAHVHTLLERGEDLPLLERRARGLAPEACPSTFARALEGVCATRTEGVPTVVELFGDSPVDPHLPALLGHDVDVRRAATAVANATNAGVVALGVSDAASGEWNRLDLMVRVHAVPSSTAHVSIGGREVEAAWEPTRDSGVEQSIVRDVMADGQTVVAWVDAGGALALDDRASLVLPVQPALRVALAPGVPAAIATALRSDPGVAVAVAESPADVVVRGEDEAFGGSTPALVLSGDTEQTAAFVVGHPATGEPERALRSAFEALGLDEIDATELAGQAARPITLELEVADVRRISIWRSLFEPQSDFTSTRVFPLFIARSVRWLAHSRSFEAKCAAGQARFGASEPWTDARGARIDTLGAEARMPRAGDIVTTAGPTRTVSLLDADTTSLATDARVLPDVESLRARFSIDPLTLVVLALLALLLVEWWLVRTERVP